MKSFRELLVWQRSMKLVTEVYNVTKNFPQEEKFGLTNQIRRASVSIPSNIAEGFGRKSEGDFSRFLSIAIASNYEVQTQLEIASNIGILSADLMNNLIVELDEIARMIKGLKAKIK